MDGTLLDTERISTWAWLEASKEMNFKLDINVLYRMKGTSIPKAKEMFDETYKMNPSFENIKTRRDRYFFDYIHNKDVPVLKGGKELLNYLKEHHYIICLATSSRKEYGEYITKKTGINTFFNYKVYGDEIVHSKPDPEIFIKTAQKSSSSIEECLVVEDSKNGIIAGYKGKFHVIGIPNAYLFEEDIKAKCDYVLDSMLDLLELFKEGKMKF